MWLVVSSWAPPQRLEEQRVQESFPSRSRGEESGNQGASPKVRSLQKCRATKNERGDANDSQLAADGTDQWGLLTGVGVTNRQCLCVALVAAWVEGARKKQRIIGWRGRRNPERRRSGDEG